MSSVRRRLTTSEINPLLTEAAINALITGQKVNSLVTGEKVNSLVSSEKINELISKETVNGLVTAERINALVGLKKEGEIGSYTFAQVTAEGPATLGLGDTVVGENLLRAGAYGAHGSERPYEGVWKCMGMTNGHANERSENGSTLFLRIS